MASDTGAAAMEINTGATTIVAERTYHELKIDGYSRSISTPGDRPVFHSCPFRAGGHTWRIRYTPWSNLGNGHGRETSDDSIAFSLVLDTNMVSEPVMATVTFTLLKHDGKPDSIYTHTTNIHHFSAPRNDIGFERFIIEREVLERSEYLTDDCFAIRVHVRIIKETPPIAVPPPDIHQQLGDLLLRKEGTDVEFDVGGVMFSAHRLVLMARSPVFRAELLGPMKEGTTTDVIQIDDMEAQVFDGLLTFIYTDTWPNMRQEDECRMSQHLLAASDRYNLQRLKLMCEERLHNHIDTWSAATILALAEKHQCIGLKKACLKFISSSAALLIAVSENEEFEYLAQSCPNIMKELISKLARDMQTAAIGDFWSGIPLFRGL
ncbi:hypothetical protein ACP70R_013281 [Stipagrostis hirtigluma subsp. patula]